MMGLQDWCMSVCMYTCTHRNLNTPRENWPSSWDNFAYWKLNPKGSIPPNSKIIKQSWDIQNNYILKFLSFDAVFWHRPFLSTLKKEGGSVRSNCWAENDMEESNPQPFLWKIRGKLPRDLWKGGMRLTNLFLKWDPGEPYPCTFLDHYEVLGKPEN